MLLPGGVEYQSYNEAQLRYKRYAAHCARLAPAGVQGLWKCQCLVEIEIYACAPVLQPGAGVIASTDLGAKPDRQFAVAL